MQPIVKFSEMTNEQRDALPIDPATGLKIVAEAQRGSVIWRALEDGSEVVRDASGRATVWPG